MPRCAALSLPRLSVLSPASVHRGNIFGAKFIPGTSDGVIASGAMDGVVAVHRLTGPSAVGEVLYRSSDMEAIKNLEVLPR